MLTKNGISISKKQLKNSQQARIASRNTIFYHEATAGQMSINLLALTMPAAVTMTQATSQEISGAQLYTNKKNLDLRSTANGPLTQGLHYDVASSYDIVLKGPYLVSGAEAGEIFTGTISASPVSDLAVPSAKSIFKRYTVTVGQTVVPLGEEFTVGGSMKVYIQGLLAERDVDYTEVSAGNGYGSSIVLTPGPDAIDWAVAVDFGVRAISDNNALGAIENISGSILKIAQDLAVLAGTNAIDYYNASPSEIDRRSFGDLVLSLQTSIATLSTGRLLRVTVFSASGTWTRPADVNSIMVRAVGGGGGGGSLSGGFGGGGGGGGSCEKFIDNPLTTYTVTIGTGGGVSTNGGATTFGAVLTANGGIGGTTGNGQPGLGGTATGGDINARGNAGTIGYSASGFGGPGTGGGSAFFGGGGGGIGSVAGAPNTGGGGNGNSGSGGSGIVVVYEFR